MSSLAYHSGTVAAGTGIGTVGFSIAMYFTYDDNNQPSYFGAFSYRVDSIQGYIANPYNMDGISKIYYGGAISATNVKTKQIDNNSKFVSVNYPASFTAYSFIYPDSNFYDLVYATGDVIKCGGNITINGVTSPTAYWEIGEQAPKGD